MFNTIRDSLAIRGLVKPNFEKCLNLRDTLFISYEGEYKYVELTELARTYANNSLMITSPLLNFFKKHGKVRIEEVIPDSFSPHHLFIYPDVGRAYYVSGNDYLFYKDSSLYSSATGKTTDYLSNTVSKGLMQKVVSKLKCEVFAEEDDLLERTYTDTVYTLDPKVGCMFIEESTVYDYRPNETEFTKTSYGVPVAKFKLIAENNE